MERFKSEPWKAPKTPPPSLVINGKLKGERFGAATVKRARLRQMLRLLGLGIRPAVIEKMVK